MFRLNSNTINNEKVILDSLLKFAKLKEEEVLKKLDTDVEGLSPEEIQKRLEIYGPNQIVKEKAPPWYAFLLRAYMNPFTYILAFIALVSLIGDVLLAKPEDRDWSTVIIISAVLIVSGFMRFVQEYRSSRASEKLKSMIYITVAIKRKREGIKEIRSEEVVPGDIVHLSAGDIVPADIRIISSKDLFVDQSILTGESEPVEKYPNLRRELDKPSLYEMENICFMGTSVVSGSAVGVVLFTGEKTYMASIARELLGKKVKTEFEKGLDNTSRIFIKFMALMFPFVFLINGFTKGDWFDALMFALAVALGLTPELLPLIVVGNLAKGALVMAKKKTIVKRLDSIQNFGAIDVLCTDKTGTLTMNKIILKKALDLEGDEDDKVLLYAFLNSYYQTGLKNLLDIAILEYGEEKGLKGSELERVYKKVDEIPFDFERRRMSVVLEIEGEGKKRKLITKGAVEEIISICQWVEYRGEVYPLTEEIKEKALKMVKGLNKDGMRVLAVARKEDVPPEEVFSVKDENNMVLVGFLAFLDPPKETAAEAIRTLKENGVEVKILTGDNEVITERICKEVGLPIKGILLGEDIENMDDAELMNRVDNTTIFAKVNPMQKARIIRVLRAKGHVVGFLGDGINDAPAMKAADVAISVDNAVDIAKESADIILLDKSLTVLGEGILEGRRVFGNILKYIAITASSNFGNVFSIMVASVFLPFLPMAPVQLVLLDTLYDISMGSIPWDKVDRDFQKVPRKWKPVNIGRFMVWFGPTSSIFDITTYALMFFLIGPLVVGGHYALLSGGQKETFISLFQTGWFVESLLTQTMVVYTLRTHKKPFIESLPSPILLTATLLAMLVGLTLPYTPLGSYFGMHPLPWFYYVILLIPTLVMYLLLAQFVKGVFIKRYGELY